MKKITDTQRLDFLSEKITKIWVEIFTEDGTEETNIQFNYMDLICAYSGNSLREVIDKSMSSIL